MNAMMPFHIRVLTKRLATIGTIKLRLQLGLIVLVGHVIAIVFGAGELVLTNGTSSFDDAQIAT